MSQFGQIGYPDITATPEYQQELAAQRAFMQRVYAWMSGGLIVSALAALTVAYSNALKTAIFGSAGVVIGLFIAMIVVSLIFNFAQSKINSAFASVLFVLYCLLFGVTGGAAVLLVYKTGTIVSAFVTAAGMFGAMSVYGYVTKKDLTSWGTFLVMGMVGLIIASIVTFIMGGASPMMAFVINVAGVIIFTGFTAYYTQMIKRSYADGEQGSEAYKKASVFGAFALYVCFVNLFLYLLQLFGSRED